jgi:hypothetical protein
MEEPIPKFQLIQPLQDVSPVELSTAAQPPIHVARLTVIEQIRYQCGYEEPLASDCRFSCILESVEQPYFRRLTATEEWNALAAGCWFDLASRVMVINREGTGAQVIPTEGEKASIKGRVLEVSLRLSAPWCDVEIPPGESCELPVRSARSLLARCRSGRALYCVYVFPR